MVDAAKDNKKRTGPSSGPAKPDSMTKGTVAEDLSAGSFTTSATGSAGTLSETPDKSKSS